MLVGRNGKPRKGNGREWKGKGGKEICGLHLLAHKILDRIVFFLNISLAIALSLQQNSILLSATLLYIFATLASQFSKDCLQGVRSQNLYKVTTPYPSKILT